MKVISRFFKLTLAVLALSSTFAAVAQAQDAYPSKPIKVVVPFPAGGATDILTRAITEKLAQRIGQSVIIENRPGAGANIGAATVAKAAPDGYTLLMGSIGSHSISVTYHKDPGYSLQKDLMPISAAGTLSNIVVVGNDVPAKNLAELVAELRLLWHRWTHSPDLRNVQVSGRHRCAARTLQRHFFHHAGSDFWSRHHGAGYATTIFADAQRQKGACAGDHHL